MDDVVETPAHEKFAAAVTETHAAAVLQPEIQDAGRNAVFSSLVKGDSDITGLVAYSIFKQNELDWLSEFRTAKGREPTDGELEAYIIGESTPRRLATYRHLADATLAGNGPDVAAGGPSGSRAIVSQPQRASQPGGLGASAVLYFVLAIGVLIAVYYAARYGLPK